MPQRSTEERILLFLAMIVGAFLLASVIVGFILAIKGVTVPNVWDQMFNLVNVLAGALVGYVSGTYVSRAAIPPTSTTQIDIHPQPKELDDQEEEGHK